ncbi:MAG: H-X9-DG-CTERM domain-containing protein, partial [Verrucomicrobiota bacterium]
KGSSGRWTEYDEDNLIISSGTGKYGSYGYNGQGGGGDSWNPDGPNKMSQSRTDLGLMGRNESDLKNPSDMIAITGSYAEVNGSIIRSLQARINGTSPMRMNERTEKDAYARHFGKLNTAFCDGHIESIKVDVLYHDKSDRMLRRWNYDNEPHREQVPAGQ